MPRSVVPAPVWSESFPGTVLPRHGDREGAFEVHHVTGRIMRQASELRLCFDCGPDGGVYHPDVSGIAAVLAATSRRKGDEGSAQSWTALSEDHEDDDLHPERVAAPLFVDYVRDIARLHDAECNRFEEHEHHAIATGQSFRHGHSDGSLIHKHPETGLATFDVNAEQVATGRPAKRTWHKAPKGEQREFVAPSDDERYFRVVLSERYLNPDAVQAMVTVRRIGERRDRGSGQKPPTNWTRAQHRADMDFYVKAIRLQALGFADALVLGPGAIPLSAARMAFTFRMQPRYEIPGWTPTFGGLP